MSSESLFGLFSGVALNLAAGMAHRRINPPPNMAKVMECQMHFIRVKSIALRAVIKSVPRHRLDDVMTQNQLLVIGLVTDLNNWGNNLSWSNAPQRKSDGGSQLSCYLAEFSFEIYS